MYVIMVYDVNVKRVVKVLKVGRKYLEHVQNSVLEGELSPAQYKKLKHEVEKTIDPEEDTVRFYLLRTTRYLTTEELGLPSRNEPDSSFL
ncbi:CRISPR-associated protein, Cas2 family [Rubrobacter xylanophilus DSM 9941]|uniref:CRISPR-associated endoribonuclease Cas2 n=1 Tax=Rubrobacter xylanophilus (strain DSM 9941 / JCM 11954 / NBRC 16129 / PRD-1) TaxID=266117 RepID=Q1AZE5_RUBXD|nr:CRISPR-associated protein, Cas2 family [Rubrobacter xylanophilus DSM 9941]